jgi:hypothetical protein
MEDVFGNSIRKVAKNEFSVERHGANNPATLTTEPI